METLRCYCCDDLFLLSKENKILFEDGEINKPVLCDECFEMKNNIILENEVFYSDADNGL